MKVTHIVWSLELGGIETMLVNIINEQVKTIDVEIIVINDIVSDSLRRQISPKCNFYSCRRKKGSRNPLPFIKLNWHLRKRNPNIIHVHLYRLSKLILGEYNIVRTIHNTRNISEEYPRMKALFAISKSVQEYTREQGFNSILIENGIDYASFSLKTIKNSQPNIINIVQIGRLHTAQKGQDIIINAAYELVKIGYENKFRITFIGDGNDYDVLRDLVVSKNLNKYIIFEGIKEQSYIKKHLCDYDLFVMPSRYEGFGLTVAEAMAARVPVLVCDIEGPMEIIDNGRCGMFFRTEDVKDLTNKLASIIDNGYDDDMIDAAQQRVKTKYNVCVTANRYIEEYKKIIKNE